MLDSIGFCWILENPNIFPANLHSNCTIFKILWHNNTFWDSHGHILVLEWGQGLGTGLEVGSVGNIADMLISWSDRSPKNSQNQWKFTILLHKWTAGPICPRWYGPDLPFSSGTSQEMSLWNPLESTLSLARSGMIFKAYIKTFPGKSQTKKKGKDHIYLHK